jgi:nucleotide-binding universal stress UspA family protein
LKIKNILLPTDFSSLSLSAAEYAVDLALKYQAKIHLLHVLEKTPPILIIRSLDLSEKKIVKALEDEAKTNLQKTLEKIKGKGDYQIETAVRKGIDYEEIVNYAEEKKIDILVIATHGRTGVLHTLLGSVAEKVIRYSKIPVLVCKCA